MTEGRHVRAERPREYEENGFLVVRGVFSAEEIAELRRESELLYRRDDLISEHNLRCRFMPNVVTGEKVFEVFDPVIDVGPVCARIASDARILGLLSELFGEPACLFKDKLIFKPPGAMGYALHQDFPANWPGFPRSFTTVLIAIDICTSENGCTEAYSGYHRQGPLMPTDGRHELPADLVDASRGVPLELGPGDVAVFGAFTPHRSAPNRSLAPRRTLYLSYNAASEGGHQRERHYAEFHEWMRRRLAPGDAKNVYFR